MSKRQSEHPHQRLKRVRERMGKSQSVMAGLLHLSLRGYQNYERGEQKIPVITLERAQANFGLNSQWVLEGEGEMFLPEAHPERARIQKALADASGVSTTVASTAQPQPVDLDRVQACIHALMLIAQQRGGKINAEAFAKACVFMYELSLQPGSMPLPRIAERLIETMA